MLSVPTGFYVLVCFLAALGLLQVLFAVGYSVHAALRRRRRARRSLENLRRWADARDAATLGGVR